MDSLWQGNDGAAAPGQHKQRGDHVMAEWPQCIAGALGRCVRSCRGTEDEPPQV
jgi:hypothetical protein